ncbi:DUF4157 domain-containing protein [Cellulomonas sp. S1-8]|uniref:eCIS core domain-containing protein n=1 Tax=Cellulomonas sp. S1-8 TaxID=2904790 RepID=UPI002244B080|nr:DUF4157 domain-containing protein [Cellulomonas sp. S1-8]UZN03704.1 DUF4157 domain-containing protein [Cellulomonas sp. S1-8]
MAQSDRRRTPREPARQAEPDARRAPAPGLGLLDAGNRAVARMVQRRGAPADPSGLAPQIAGRLGGGEPLAGDVRARLESGLGADLTGVRVHRDPAAAGLADSLDAQAFTTGQDVFFGAGRYRPGTPSGDHLIAHEVAHTLQGGPAPAASPGDGGLTVSDPESTAEKEAEAVADAITSGRTADVRTHPTGEVRRSPGDLTDTDLLLGVDVAGTTVSYWWKTADLERGLVDHLRAQPQDIAVIETQIVAALRDDAGPVHESQVYLQSPPVAEDLRRDLAGWPSARVLTRYPARFAARAAAIRASALRYPLEQNLEASGTLRPGDIDWAAEVAALRGTSPGPDRTVLDAARRDRFELALSVLDREGAQGPQPAPGLSPHPDLLGPIIYARYAATDPAPSELATADMTRTHSEAFLAQWLPTLRDTRLIPDDFDVSALEPTGEMDALRRELVTRYVAEAAPRTMEKFLLDRWVADGRTPEKFVQTADISGLRAELLEALGKDFPRWAPTQPGFVGAFWSDVGQRAAFTAVRTLVTVGRSLQAFHAGLADRFASVGPAQLTSEEFAIAQDPYGYSQKVAAVAALTSALTASLQPGALLEHGLLAWYQGIAAAWSVNGEDARGVAGLLAVFQGLGGLRSAIEAQQTAARMQIAGQLDTGFDAIAGIVRAEAQYAEEFITNTWVPMLKTVALEQVTRNRDEMKEHLASWPTYRAQASARFRIVAHFLDDLITRLQSGDLDSAEMNGQMVTATELPQLIQARDFMRGQAEALQDDDTAEDKKDDLTDAVAGFEKVRQRILDGDYKPVDYSRAVYDEARVRLGLVGYEHWVTLGAALDRWAIVPQNPFLAYAIARWQWEERVAQLDRQFLIFIALGLLTVASLVVPGAAGLVLAGVDVAAGIAMGVKGVVDAYELVDLALLDPTGAVGGVTVEQARAALRTAWIGLGINILLVGGLAAVWAALRLAGRGAGDVPAELAHLSTLMKSNPVLAEQLMAKVKDFAKLEDLLSTTNDAVLLERMLARTSDVRHLQYALMHGDPTTIARMIDLAGDSRRLGLVLDHAPDVVTAERLLLKTGDAEGLSLLLRSADNAHIAEAVLDWAKDPRIADRLLGLSAGDQAGVLRLPATGLTPEQAVAALPRCANASELAALVPRMEKPEQVVGLLGRHSPAELNGLLDRGIRPSEIQMGVGTPGVAAVQPTFPVVRPPMPPEATAILDAYGVGSHPNLLTAEPRVVERITRTMKDGGGLASAVDQGARQKAATWAADGAASPNDFVDRWEFFKKQVDETAKTLTAPQYANVNKKAAAAKILTDDITLVETALTTRAGTMRDLGGLGWADVDGIATPELVRGNATKLTFGSETNAAYHPDKHFSELPLSEQGTASTPAGRAQAYLASARRTVSDGALVKVEDAGEGALRMVFKRSSEGKDVQTIVITRENWALIASHGKPGGR